MTDSNNLRFSYRAYLAFVVPYSVSVAALYLFSFWGAFDINVLEFVSLADMVKLAAYPLVVASTILLAGYAVPQIIVGEYLPPGAGADTAIGRFGRKHMHGLLTAGLAAIIIVAIYVPGPVKWLIVLFFAGIFSVPMNHAAFVITLIPNPRARAVVLPLVAIMPVIALYWGAVQADRAKRGEAPLMADVARSNLTLPLSDNGHLIYLGHLSDYFVLLDSASGSLVFVKTRDDSPFVLQHNPQTLR